MISVVMGVHRMSDYLFPAIDSVLAQEGVDFEFLIVTNGEHCSSIAETIEARYPDEPRIRILKTPIAQLAHALNLGITAASYEYIARIDADDIALSGRFRKQLDYLREHDLDLVGTAILLIDENGETIGSRSFPEGRKIRSLLPFKNCFSHSSLLYKRDVLLKARGYNAGFNSEDYDLWLRLRRQRVSWDNMVEPLMAYRVHDEASQRRILGYAEASGYMLREFVLSMNPRWLVSAAVAVGKAVLRGR